MGQKYTSSLPEKDKKKSKQQGKVITFLVIRRKKQQEGAEVCSMLVSKKEIKPSKIRARWKGRTLVI